MKPPAFWNDPQSRPALRALLRPVAAIYAWAGRRRQRMTEPLDPGIPVICVGNATLGGTGKTPVAIYLLKSFRRLGIQAHALTRGYGGQEKGPLPVSPRHSAADVGDEPLLLARHGPVWVAAGRDEGAAAAVSNGAAVIILDDGLQNPTVAKTLAFMVVDAEVGFGNGCVFPAGPLREPLSDALSRTDAVILMKPDPSYEIDNRLAEQLADQVVIPAYLSPKTTPPRGKLYAFAGIGRPEKFFNALRRSGGNVVDARPFADHHRYRDREVETLFELASEYGAALITTEKDYVRLPRGYRKGVHAFPVDVVFEDELTLRRLLHPIIEATQPK